MVQKLVCPNCGAEMNHHATKVDLGMEDSVSIESDFGGALKDAYYCPHCGHSELINSDTELQ